MSLKEQQLQQYDLFSLIYTTSRGSKSHVMAPTRHSIPSPDRQAISTERSVGKAAAGLKDSCLAPCRQVLIPPPEHLSNSSNTS